MNTAKSREIAVNACSPPDSKVMFCIFFPGGLANISSPELKDLHHFVLV